MGNQDYSRGPERREHWPESPHQHCIAHSGLAAGINSLRSWVKSTFAVVALILAGVVTFNAFTYANRIHIEMLDHRLAKIEKALRRAGFDFENGE